MSGLLWTILHPKQATLKRYGDGDDASKEQLQNRQQDRAAGMALARNAQQEAESLAQTQARVGQIIPQANARFEGGGRALPLSSGGILSGYRPPAPIPYVGSLGADPLGRRWR